MTIDRRRFISAAAAGKAAYEGYQGHGVLTYAILEALHRPEGAAAEPISVLGIGSPMLPEYAVASTWLQVADGLVSDRP